MKRKELGRELARAAHMPHGAAQDQVDALVHDIVRKLRAGRPVKLPGLGKLLGQSTRRGKK
ncbi:MAG: HU family DNA-binding protein [Acidobacteriota bacterium]